MNLYEVVLQVQKDLHAGNLRSPNCGICTNVDRYSDHGSISDTFKAAVRSWKHYSGSILYPIKGGSVAYDRAWGTDEMWSKTQRYGRLRRSLLNHLVETLKPKESATYKELLELKGHLQDSHTFMCWVAQDHRLKLAENAIQAKVDNEGTDNCALLNVYYNKYNTTTTKRGLTPEYLKFRKEWLDSLIEEHK